MPLASVGLRGETEARPVATPGTRDSAEDRSRDHDAPDTFFRDCLSTDWRWARRACSLSQASEFHCFVQLDARLRETADSPCPRHDIGGLQVAEVELKMWSIEFEAQFGEDH